MARQAEADVYASETFTAAQDTLDAGIKERERQDERFKLFRSYGKAREKFLRAAELANQAGEQAADAKSRQAEECRAAVEQAAAAVDSCAVLLDKAPKRGKGTRADLRMLREDLTTLANELGEANDDLDNSRFSEGKAKAEIVIEKAAIVCEQITEALAKRK